MERGLTRRGRPALADHRLPTRNPCQSKEKEKREEAGKKGRDVWKKTGRCYSGLLTIMKMLLGVEGAARIAGYASLK